MVEPSGDLQAVFDRAVGSAKSWRHEYVTLEHLLFSMLEDKKFNGIVKEYGADPEDMKNMMSGMSGMGQVPEDINEKPTIDEVD